MEKGSHINMEREERETLILKQPIIGTFGSKLQFTVGTAYIGFGIFGFILGAFRVKSPVIKFPTKRLLVSYYFNNMMQKGLTYANNAGGAAFIYTLTGYLIFKGFEEELYFINDLSKNMLIGGISGAIFKSTLGYKAATVGGLVGAGLIAGLNVLADELSDRDIIDIEMRFDS
jgi:hypothetical protein